MLEPETLPRQVLAGASVPFHPQRAFAGKGHWRTVRPIRAMAQRIAEGHPQGDLVVKELR